MVPPGFLYPGVRMSAHTKYGPSQTDRFANCTGALTLCAALPDHQRNVSGPAAQLGTAVHGLIEESLAKNVEPESFRGRIIVIDLEENAKLLTKSAKTPKNMTWFEVDDDIIDGATCMTDYVRRRAKELKLDLTNRDEVQLESRTNPLPERDDTSGTADVTLKAWPIMLEVVDYKNGWNLVEHFGNKQLKSYLLGKAIESNFEFAHYAITIVQPNAEHEEGKERTFTISAAELRDYQAELRGYVEACDEADAAKGAPRPGFTTVSPVWAKKYLKASRPGTNEKDHCMFCDAKPVCPAYIAMRQTEAAIDFDDEPAPLPAPESGPDVARILRWKPHFDQLFKAAFAYGQRELETGRKVPGFKLAETRPHRKLKPMTTEELVAALVKRFKLTRADLFNAALKTGPQIEKLIPAKQRKDFEAEFMYRPRGVAVIVPEEDARDEVIKNVGDDFPDDLDGGDLDFG
jgi:hypothetical protein